MHHFKKEHIQFVRFWRGTKNENNFGVGVCFEGAFNKFLLLLEKPNFIILIAANIWSFPPPREPQYFCGYIDTIFTLFSWFFLACHS